MQVEPQASKPESQAIVHAPALQRAAPFSGTPQAALHAPQWAFDEASSTHAPLQLTVPGAHESVHAPPEHTVPAAHTAPQAPQCRGLLERSTHVSPHSTNPSSQCATHAPRSQTATPSGGGVQVAPQTPQFFGSLSRTAQRPAQTVSPSAQATASPRSEGRTHTFRSASQT